MPFVLHCTFELLLFLFLRVCVFDFGSVLFFVCVEVRRAYGSGDDVREPIDSFSRFPLFTTTRETTQNILENLFPTMMPFVALGGRH
jgi:hypothetical protein